MSIKAEDYLSFVFVISGSDGFFGLTEKYPASMHLPSIFMTYKLLLIVLITLTAVSFFQTPVFSQSLRVDILEQGSSQTRYFESGSRADGYAALTWSGNRFRAGEQAASYSNVVDYAISPDGRFIGLLIRGEGSSYGVNILNSDGTLYQQHEDVVILESSDNSNKIFVHNDGSFTIRNNIAGFTLFNPGGVETGRVFNNSGSLRGEAVSELVQSRQGRRLAVYNPRIVTDIGNQSRIQLIEGNRLQHVYTFTEGSLSSVVITDNADRFVALVNGSSSGLLFVLDTDGTVRKKIEVAASPSHLFVNGDGSHAAVTKDNRVELYDLETGERVASTATRANVVFARFDSGSDRLVMLTGSHRERNGVLTNPEVYVVNTARRSLMREQFDATLHWDPDNLPVTMKDTGDLNWLLLGMNKPMRISVR